MCLMHSTQKYGENLFVSFDGGESWTPVLRYPDLFTSMMKFNDVLYVQVAKEPFLQLYRVSAEDNRVNTCPWNAKFRYEKRLYGLHTR